MKRFALATSAAADVIDLRHTERFELGCDHAAHIDMGLRVTSVDDGVAKLGTRGKFRGDVLANFETANLDEGADCCHKRSCLRALAKGTHASRDRTLHRAAPTAVHGRRRSGVGAGKQHRGAIGHACPASYAWSGRDGDVALHCPHEPVIFRAR